MTGEENVREFLQERGLRPQIVQGGLAGLVARWEGVAQTLAAGYTLGLSDYVGDLDVRQLLADVLAVADDEQRQAVSERLHQADERVKGATELTSFCMWGERVMRDQGWTPEVNWWYFIRPRKASRSLREELDELALDFLP